MAQVQKGGKFYQDLAHLFARERGWDRDRGSGANRKETINKNGNSAQLEVNSI